MCGASKEPCVPGSGREGRYHTCRRPGAVLCYNMVVNDRAWVEANSNMVVNDRAWVEANSNMVVNDRAWVEANSNMVVNDRAWVG